MLKKDTCSHSWRGFEGMGTTVMNDDDDEFYRHYMPADNDDDNRHHQNNHHHDKDAEHRRHRDGRWPQWLQPMLSARFFVQCTKPHHADANASTATTSCKATECNMYCLDCSSSSGALCPLCVPSHRRAGHRTVQIRRSSYHDVVRVGEIQRVLDVSGVQTYVINSARVVFLNERPQTKGKAERGSGGGGGGGGGGGANACEVCRRMLLDSFRFCSLGCKVAGTSKSNKHHVTKKHQQLAFPNDSNSDYEGSCTTTDDRRARSTGGGASSGSDGDGRHRRLVPSPPKPLSAGPNHTSDGPLKRRRKGVPHRAPFGTSLVFDYYY